MGDELNQKIYLSGEIVDSDATTKLEELFAEAEKSNKGVVQIKAVDMWGERRYQIAKDALTALMSNPKIMSHERYDIIMAVYKALQAADILIEELKKQ